MRIQYFSYHTVPPKDRDSESNFFAVLIQQSLHILIKVVFVSLHGPIISDPLLDSSQGGTNNSKYDSEHRQKETSPLLRSAFRLVLTSHRIVVHKDLESH